MALNYITLVLDLADGTGTPLATGQALLNPSAQLTDATDDMIVTKAQLSAKLAGSYLQARLLATDNTALRLQDGRGRSLSPGRRGTLSRSRSSSPYGIDAGAHKVGLPASERADHPIRARPFGMWSPTASHSERRRCAPYLSPGSVTHREQKGPVIRRYDALRPGAGDDFGPSGSSSLVAGRGNRSRSL
jgi:hypothetical protein